MAHVSHFIRILILTRVLSNHTVSQCETAELEPQIGRSSSIEVDQPIILAIAECIIPVSEFVSEGILRYNLLEAQDRDAERRFEDQVAGGGAVVAPCSA